MENLLCGECIADIMNVDPTNIRVDYQEFDSKERIASALEYMANQLRIGHPPYTRVWMGERGTIIRLRSITVIQGVPLCANHAADRRWLYHGKG